MSLVVIFLVVIGATVVYAHGIEFHPEVQKDLDFNDCWVINDLEDQAQCYKHIGMVDNFDDISTCVDKKTFADKLNCYDSICDFSSGEEATQCMMSHTVSLFMENKAEEVMDVVDEAIDLVTSNIDNAAFDEHLIGHAVGQGIYLKYGRGSENFQKCPFKYNAGCYHGFLIIQMEQEGRSMEELATELCNSITSSSFKENVSCPHAVGHGILLVGHGLEEALNLCDKFEKVWQREGCYQGYFMELEGAVQDGIEPPGIYEEKDLLAPCNRLDKKYKEMCYGGMSAYLMMRYNYDDYKAATHTCLEADEGYVEHCLIGFGLMAGGINSPWQPVILGDAYQDSSPRNSFAICSLFPDTYTYVCADMAVYEYLNYINLDDIHSKNNAYIMQNVEEFCDLYRGSSKELCNNTIIEAMVNLAPSVEVGTDFCQILSNKDIQDRCTERMVTLLPQTALFLESGAHDSSERGSVYDAPNIILIVIDKIKNFLITL